MDYSECRLWIIPSTDFGLFRNSCARRLSQDVKTGTGGWQSLPSMPILDCNRSVKCHQNEADLTEYLADMHKYYNYKLCKIALGKDEVAGSNPAISSSSARKF